MICIEVTLSGTADSIANLINSSLPVYLQDNTDLKIDCILQNEEGNDTLYMGSSVEQKGFILAGGSAGFNQLNLNTTYIDGTGSDNIIVLLMD